MYCLRVICAQIEHNDVTKKMQIAITFDWIIVDSGFYTFSESLTQDQTHYHY